MDGVVSRAVDVEDLVHPHQLEQRADRLGHRAQLQVAPLGVELPQAGQNRAEPRAVDEAQLAEVEHHLLARLEHRCHVPLEFLGVARVELFSRQHHDRDVADLLRRQFHEGLLIAPHGDPGPGQWRFLIIEIQCLPRSSR